MEILLPEGNRHNEVPKLVALLLDCLSSSNASEQLVEISNGMVLSGNPKVREFLTMVLRAKRFDEFLEQLRASFFTCDVGLGELRCVRDGVSIVFRFAEVRTMPNLKWKVNRNI